MDNNIFYYQCELTGALIGLARATEGNESKITNSTYLTMPEGLSVSAAALDKETFSAVLGRLEAEKKKLIPLCYDCASPCGRTANYNIQNLWSSPAKIRALKTLILYGLNGMAVYAYRAALLGCFDSEINDFSAERFMP